LKRYILVVSLLILISFASLVTGCANRANKPEEPAAANELEFNLVFKYGIGAKNVLNTCDGTYTKDMVAGPPVTTHLSLSRDELSTIYNKMVEIDFFNYPDKFAVYVPPGEPVCMVTPHESYYFKVEHGSKIKELSWEDSITNANNDADKLRELIRCIRDIVESKREYKKLPPPRGGYD